VNDIFAYETNGLGSRYVMDDANVPVSVNHWYVHHAILIVVQSLLSLPYLGFLNKTHPAYVATRNLLLSRNNPYYAQGKTFRGIGCA
jgi:uncharacterized protein